MLGIAQRKIKVRRTSPILRRCVKPVPSAPKTPGDHIKVGRYKAGLKLKDLAEKLGFSVSDLHSMEVDRRVPSTSEWIKIASLLEVPVRMPQ